MCPFIEGKKILQNHDTGICFYTKFSNYSVSLVAESSLPSIPNTGFIFYIIP